MEGSHLNSGVHNAGMSFLSSSPSLSTAAAFPTDDVIASTRVELKQEAYRLKMPWANETLLLYQKESGSSIPGQWLQFVS